DPMHSRAQPAGRSHQSERRRHRDRPPDRGIGRTSRRYVAPRARAAGRALRHRDDVHRGRAGPGDALRTGVLTRAILTRLATMGGGLMGGFRKNELAEKRGYTYRLTRRQFLVATSAAALAACGPAAVTPGASPSASPGKELKLGQLLPFTGV